MPAAGVSQSRSIASTTRTRSALATSATGRTGPCAAANRAWRVVRRKLGVSRQPGRQVGRALEVEQGIGQGFQLLHW
jgi:hypothetical protein